MVGRGLGLSVPEVVFRNSGFYFWSKNNGLLGSFPQTFFQIHILSHCVTLISES